MDGKTTKLLQRIADERDTITKIDLSRTFGLSEVPEIIRECRQVEFLDLTSVSVTTVPDWVFSLPKLKRLRLFCTSLTAVPSSLGLATGLEELWLDVNPGAPLPSDLFTLTNLRTLLLSGEITSLPDDIAKLHNLEDLELIGTRVRQLPDAMGKLKRFAIAQSIYPMFPDTPPIDLDQIIGVLAQCPTLQTFEVRGSLVTPIPASIGTLTGLKKLVLTECKLTDYPTALYDLANLTELHMGVNEIGAIHPGIGRLKKLKLLILNANWTNKLDVSALFEEIAALAALEELDLSNCLSVTTLPAAIVECKRLKKIDVDNNIITSLPDELGTMTWLKILRISTNKLSPEIGARLQAALPTTKVSV